MRLLSHSVVSHALGSTIIFSMSVFSNRSANSCTALIEYGRSVPFWKYARIAACFGGQCSGRRSGAGTPISKQSSDQHPFSMAVTHHSVFSGFRGLRVHPLNAVLSETSDIQRCASRRYQCGHRHKGTLSYLKGGTTATDMGRIFCDDDVAYWPHGQNVPFTISALWPHREKCYFQYLPVLTRWTECSVHNIRALCANALIRVIQLD